MIAMALVDSPSLEELAERETALRSTMAGAGVWSDPTVSLEYSNVPISSFSVAEHGM